MIGDLRALVGSNENAGSHKERPHKALHRERGSHVARNENVHDFAIWFTSRRFTGFNLSNVTPRMVRVLFLRKFNKQVELKSRGSTPAQAPAMAGSPRDSPQSAGPAAAEVGRTVPSPAS